MLLTVEVLASVSEGSSPVALVLSLVATALASLGGVAALLKARADKKIGVAQQEAAEDDAISKQWHQIIETQTKALLEPMRAEITELKSEMREVKIELEKSRRKYWGAISYIRILLMWIGKHIEQIGVDETTGIPPAPASIAEDI